MLSIPGQRGDIAMTRRVTLESSDEAIVRLAPTETEPGRILTGGTPGTATITATTSAGIQATATVRVRDVLESLEIRPRQTELANNAIGRFQVIGTYQNGKRRYLTRYAEVSTTNPSIVELRENVRTEHRRSADSGARPGHRAFLATGHHPGQPRSLIRADSTSDPLPC